MKKFIVIVGPTASGKTKLAVELAREFEGEIVSADSRQVYRGMDIGTGKDLKEYIVARSQAPSGLATIPYHLINIVSPRTNFTLAQYQKLAYRAIEDILRRGKVPILVGGTGLYVQAVVDGYVLPHASPNPKLRAQLAKLSLTALCAQLKKLDPVTHRVIDKHNRRRLERAIEICMATGVPLSKQREKQAPPYDVFMLGLVPSRKVLDRRIDARLKERLGQGMIEEVARLHKQGVSWRRLESFGLEYRYISRYLRSMLKMDTSGKKHAKLYDRKKVRGFDKFEKGVEYKKMARELGRAIKDFSRRQMTWFKRDKRIAWISNKSEAVKLVRKFIL